MRIVSFITTKNRLRYLIGNSSHRELVEELAETLRNEGEGEHISYNKRYCAFIETLKANSSKTSHTILYGESSDYPHVTQDKIDFYFERYHGDRENCMTSEEVAMKLVEKLQENGNNVNLFYETNL